MVEILKSWDHKWFVIINSWYSLTADQFMIFITDSSWFFLIPMIFAFLYFKFKRKFLLYVMLFGVSWGLSDVVSSKIFKKNVKRLRPCHSEVHSNARLAHPEGCGGQYGFVSSHAANSASIALLIVLVFSQWYRYIIILWAILIGYSRIYLGKHYPIDVLGGFLLGAIITYFCYCMFVKWVSSKYEY